MRLGAVALVLVLVAPPLTAEAQPVEKVPRVAYLSVESAEDDKSRVAAFRQGLRELGYVEGENIVVEYRAALPRERMLEVAADFTRLKVDVLVVRGWHDDLKKLTIPIVLPVHADPVGVGLVASLARPGGNITGLSDLHGATVSKRLELLKEVRPLASRVAVLWSPLSPIALPQLKSLQAAAPALGMTTLSLEIRRADDIDRAFRVIGNERPGALLVIAEPIVATHRRRIAELAIKHRLATIGTTRRFTDAGFLMAYGANFEDLWRRAATYVDKILKGANPGDLPIEQASKWDLAINLKTAKAIGVTIPASLILRAD
ncbi:MAG: ABC transporter substrate-binding protein, partial [Candidatus Rokuibacteriota bacterium]